MRSLAAFRPQCPSARTRATRRAIHCRSPACGTVGFPCLPAIKWSVGTSGRPPGPRNTPTELIDSRGSLGVTEFLGILRPLTERLHCSGQWASIAGLAKGGSLLWGIPASILPRGWSTSGAIGKQRRFISRTLAPEVAGVTRIRLPQQVPCRLQGPSPVRSSLKKGLSDALIAGKVIVAREALC